MGLKIKTLIFIFTFGYLASTLFAGSNERTVKAVRVTKAPRIDGFLNEPEWNLAEPAKDFIQRYPIENIPATEKTEIRVLYDNEAIYFGCTMYDSEPGKIVTRLARRDNEVESDIISIRMDPYHDHQTGYEFTILSSGTKVDILVANDGNDEDDSWDPVWDVKTRILDNGWAAEVKIPFKILRYQKENTIWGMEFIRRISRKQERDYWAFIPKSANGFVSFFGHLNGLENLPNPRQLEILPYVVGGPEYTERTPGNPDGRNLTSNIGFDIKYGLTSNLTLDATFNPDFGQVEADPSVLNLSTFETFYPEKRPFFIEGSQILSFEMFPGSSRLYYSRRIGRSPTIPELIPEGWFLKDKPKRTTILNAIKITGKTPGGYSIGILNAITQEETALVDSAGGKEQKRRVEPAANYSLIRIRKDVLSNSNVGFILTSVAKQNELPAQTAGLDWNLKFKKSYYVIDGFLALTRTRGPVYFNEPLPQHLITGSAGRIRFGELGAEHWVGDMEFDFTARQFNVNDIGYFRRPNDWGSVSSLAYRELQPGKIIRSWYVQGRYHIRHNFWGDLINNDFGSETYWQLLNYWAIQTDWTYNMKSFDDRETRGYQLFQKPEAIQVSGELSTDNRKQFVGDFAIEGVSTANNSHSWGTRAGVQWKATPSTEYSMEVGYSLSRNNLAWFGNKIASLVSPLDSTFFGRRNTNEFNFTLRGEISFTHNLTFQLYNQFFFAKGKYYNFQYQAGPDRFIAYSSVPPTTDREQTFNEFSWHSNWVLRWEYLPGSVAYLVWQHIQAGNNGSYDENFSNHVNNLFRSHPDNIYLLKISYWISK